MQCSFCFISIATPQHTEHHATPTGSLKTRQPLLLAITIQQRKAVGNRDFRVLGCQRQHSLRRSEKTDASYDSARWFRFTSASDPQTMW